MKEYYESENFKLRNKQVSADWGWKEIEAKDRITLED